MFLTEKRCVQIALERELRLGFGDLFPLSLVADNKDLVSCLMLVVVLGSIRLFVGLPVILGLRFCLVRLG